uniref:Uncharacterized protein n=1 Tax=Anguilla anguilla TaxID=7936 RepID=A0A0E9S9B6_ANGAN
MSVRLGFKSLHGLKQTLTHYTGLQAN